LKEEHFDGCLRPTLSEYAKFTPQFGRDLLGTTVQRFAASVQKKYDEILASEGEK
jgi:hypothetical protein